MGPVERQRQIINSLFNRRKETVSNLAIEFDVNERTIRRDIEELSLTYPIETNRGRYGGGVKLADWYQPSKKVLTPEQANALIKAASLLEGTERQALMSILTQFSAP